MEVNIVRVDKDLPCPKYQKHGDAGMDLHSSDEFTLQPGERRLASAGIKIALPIGYEMQIRPRSGLAHKFGISMVNAPGTIDAGYRGLISVNLINMGNEPFEVKKGDRIAQMILKKVETIDFNEVEELDDTQRGEGGHGHTGL